MNLFRRSKKGKDNGKSKGDQDTYQQTVPQAQDESSSYSDSGGNRQMDFYSYKSNNTNHKEDGARQQQQRVEEPPPETMSVEEKFMAYYQKKANSPAPAPTPSPSYQMPSGDHLSMAAETENQKPTEVPALKTEPPPLSESERRARARQAVEDRKRKAREAVEARKAKAREAAMGKARGNMFNDSSQQEEQELEEAKRQAEAARLEKQRLMEEAEAARKAQEAKERAQREAEEQARQAQLEAERDQAEAIRLEEEKLEQEIREAEEAHRLQIEQELAEEEARLEDETAAEKVAEEEAHRLQIEQELAEEEARMKNEADAQEAAAKEEQRMKQEEAAKEEQRLRKEAAAKEEAWLKKEAAAKEEARLAKLREEEARQQEKQTEEARLEEQRRANEEAKAKEEANRAAIEEEARYLAEEERLLAEEERLLEEEGRRLEAEAAAALEEEQRKAEEQKAEEDRLAIDKCADELAQTQLEGGNDALDEVSSEPAEAPDPSETDLSALLDGSMNDSAMLDAALDSPIASIAAPKKQGSKGIRTSFSKLLPGSKKKQNGKAKPKESTTKNSGLRFYKPKVKAPTGPSQNLAPSGPPPKPRAPKPTAKTATPSPKLVVKPKPVPATKRVSSPQDSLPKPSKPSPKRHSPSKRDSPTFTKKKSLVFDSGDMHSFTVKTSRGASKESQDHGVPHGPDDSRAPGTPARISNLPYSTTPKKPTRLSYATSPGQSVGSTESAASIDRIPPSPHRPFLHDQENQEPAPICDNTFVAKLHASVGPCQVCVFRLSESEKARFEQNGRHLRVNMSHAGCLDCAAFPSQEGEDPVRLCKSCFFNTHKLRRRKEEAFSGIRAFAGANQRSPDRKSPRNRSSIG